MATVLVGPRSETSASSYAVGAQVVSLSHPFDCLECSQIPLSAYFHGVCSVVTSARLVPSTLFMKPSRMSPWR